MPKIFDAILNKKKFFFAFLFVIIFSIGFFGMDTHTAKAEGAACAGGCPAGEVCDFATGTCVSSAPVALPAGAVDVGVPGMYVGSQGLTSVPASAITSSSKDKFQCTGTFNVYCGILTAIGNGFLWIYWELASIASILFGWVVSNFLNKQITTDGTLLLGWNDVKNLANMVVVLGFVVVGIATALRIRQYSANQLLWKLIAIALLINFSGLLCGLIIDAAKIIITSLAGISPNGSQASGIMTSLTKNESAFVNNATSPEGYLGNCIFYSALYLGVAVTFFYMSFVFIERYAILAILFILSPLAFAFWVFPASKKLWTEWWNHFLKWTFVGVQSMFFIWLATQMIGDPAAIAANWTSLIVILVIMVVGVKISMKSSPFLAAATMGLAGAAVGVATGGVGAVAGLTGLKGVAQNIGQGAKDKVTSMGESLNLVKKGTTAQNRASRLDEPSKRLNAITDNKELAKIAEQRSTTSTKSAEKAAAAKILMDRNSFGDVSQENRGAVLAHAKSFGVDTRPAMKADPRLAGDKLQETVERMSPPEFAKNVSKDAYSAEVLQHTTADQAKAVFGRNGTPEKRRAFTAAVEKIKDTNKSKYTQLSDAIKEFQEKGEEPPPVPPANQEPPPVPPGEQPPSVPAAHYSSKYKSPPAPGSSARINPTYIENKPASKPAPEEEVYTLGPEHLEQETSTEKWNRIKKNAKPSSKSNPDKYHEEI